MKRYSLQQLLRAETPLTVHIHSTEGDIYTANCSLANSEHALICQNDGRILVAHSLAEMHSFFAGIPTAEVLLVTRTPYDEMIGTETVAEPVTTRLNWA